MENLKNLLKTDKTGLVSGYCSIPWTNILINENGSIFNCNCEGFVKKPIGNILDITDNNEFLKIFSNNIMKDSILNGSYKLCYGQNCFILQNNILKKDVSKIFYDNEINLSKLKLHTLYLQIDQSCNLACPTCRNKIIIYKNNDKTHKIKCILEKIEKLILEKLDSVLEIRLVGNGELFASYTILEWFLNFNFEKYPNVKFSIHTNATLISRYENYLLKIVDKLNNFEISTDASNHNTYKKVRKNGNWIDLLNGYKTIEKLRQNNKKISLTSSFVVSSLNYKDIPTFIDFAKTQKSNIVFYKVLRWSLDQEKFNSLNIFSPTHPEHEDFKKIINFIKPYKNNIFILKI